jgi:hypothetical protein
MNQGGDRPPREVAVFRLTPTGRAMAFLRFHREGIGLLIGGAIVMVLGGLALVIATRETITYGTITDLSFGVDKSPSAANAHVQVDGREALVRLPAAYGCALGDRVELRRRRVIAGNTYSLGPRGCWGLK